MKAEDYLPLPYYDFDIPRKMSAGSTTVEFMQMPPGYMENLPVQKSHPQIHPAFAKDALAVNELLSMKTKLEIANHKLNQEILEKQQTLRMVEKALDSASRDFHSASTSRLATGLAHEIRNPLTTIKGFIQLLKPELQSLGKQEFADVALEELNRANSLLSEFLSVLKPNSSQKKALSINSLANSMLNLYSSEATLRNIEISADLPEEEFLVLADEYSIKQVMVNLLKNAIEAVEGAEKSSIKMVVEKEENFVHFSVIDNGNGIEDFSLRKLFTPFYTTKEDGTGIGLAISKQIIEDHGGNINVTSEPGRTVFTFTLPSI